MPHCLLAIFSVVDPEILSVGDTSLVNGLGYAIDDSSITASSSFASGNCEPQNARNIEGSSSGADAWWCCGSGEFYELRHLIMTIRYCMFCCVLIKNTGTSSYIETLYDVKK